MSEENSTLSCSVVP